MSSSRKKRRMRNREINLSRYSEHPVIVNIDDLPTANIEDKVIPQCCCVYLIYDKSNVIYVGYTTNLRKRIQTHKSKRDSFPWKKSLRLSWIEDAPQWYEGSMIEKLSPRYNDKYNPSISLEKILYNATKGKGVRRHGREIQHNY